MTSKVHQWFNIAEEMVSLMLKKTKGTPFEQEATEIAEEFNRVQDIFLERIAFDGPWDARAMYDSTMALQQRLFDIGVRTEMPI